MLQNGATFGTDSNEPSYFMYWDLMTNYTEEKGYQYGYNVESKARVLWHPSKQAYISFDDIRSVKAKTKWAKKQGLAGVFTWELSGDRENELIKTMHKTAMNE